MQVPDWHVMFDDNKEMAVESRKRILSMLASSKIPMIGYHMPFPAIGFVEKIIAQAIIGYLFLTNSVSNI